MAQLNGLIVSDDEEFVIAHCTAPPVGRRVGSSDRRDAAQSTPPDVVIVDIRATPVGGDAGDRAAARTLAACRHLRDRRRRSMPTWSFNRCEPGPTSSSPGRRPPRRLTRRCGGRPRVVPRRRPSTQADDDGVLRRQGRCRHDHARGELRRRDRPAEEAADAHRRSEGRASGK